MLPLPPKDAPDPLREIEGATTATEEPETASSRLGGPILKTSLVFVSLLFLLVILAGLLVSSRRVCWDRWDNIRVTGHLLDAVTGEPVVGAEVLTLSSALSAGSEEAVQKRRTWALEYLGILESERAAGYDDSSHCPLYGLATTDAEGHFDVCRQASYGGTDSGWRCSSRSYAPPPYHGVEALLVQWSDGRRAVLETSAGTWTVVNRDGTYALIDMGTVRISGK